MMIGYDIYDCFTMEHFRLCQRLTLTTNIYCSRLYVWELQKLHLYRVIHVRWRARPGKNATQKTFYKALLVFLKIKSRIQVGIISVWKVCIYIEQSNYLICNRVIHGFESVCLLQLICSRSNLCLLKRGVQVTTYDFGFMDNSITN
jgi:hypothetical protein